MGDTIDRDKVIQRLEDSVKFFKNRVNGVKFAAWMGATRDAIKLLKSQEPVVPVFSPEIEMDMSHWDCGACGGFLMGNAYPNAIKYIRPQYCSHCGRPVKWG